MTNSSTVVPLVTSPQFARTSNSVHDSCSNCMILTRPLQGLRKRSICKKFRSQSLTRIPTKKEYGDRAPEIERSPISSPVDVVVLEGWCFSFYPLEEAEPVRRGRRYQGCERETREVWLLYMLPLSLGVALLCITCISVKAKRCPVASHRTVS